MILSGTIHIKSSALRSSNLTTKFLNGIPFASIFTLRTNQTFDHAIKVEGSVNVKQPMIVHEQVNGRSLAHERDNTVMVSISLVLRFKFIINPEIFPSLMNNIKKLL